MTSAVLPMGRSRSPQADAIRELYRREQATSMHRTVLKHGVIRVALFNRSSNRPVSVWHVHPDGTTTQQDVER